MLETSQSTVFASACRPHLLPSTLSYGWPNTSGRISHFEENISVLFMCTVYHVDQALSWMQDRYSVTIKYILDARPQRNVNKYGFPWRAPHDERKKSNHKGSYIKEIPYWVGIAGAAR